MALQTAIKTLKQLYMVRKSKVKELESENVAEEPELVSEPIPEESKITKLSIDYPSEGLNNIARKINEIIDILNG